MADLWDKVWVIEGTGETIDTFLYKADRAVQEELPELVGEVTRDAVRLRQAVDEIAFKMDAFPALKDELFRRAFDIRGLGGTLDYPLAGDIAASMSDLIDRLETLDERAVTLLRGHADAILWLFREQIVGERDRRGIELLDELRDAAQAYRD